MRGFTVHQTLLKSYISDGLRRARLADALKRRGVTDWHLSGSK